MDEEEKKKRREAKARRRGLLLVFTGNGKGKSTAAFGLALRAAGNRLPVKVIQFRKGARSSSSHCSATSSPVRGGGPPAKTKVTDRSASTRSWVRSRPGW